MPEAHFEATPDGEARYVEADPVAVVVPGVLEARADEAALCEIDGVTVIIRGRNHGRLGSLASSRSPVVKARPDLFQP
jgi:hypothetical protein